MTTFIPFVPVSDGAADPTTTSFDSSSIAADQTALPASTSVGTNGGNNNGNSSGGRDRFEGLGRQRPDFTATNNNNNNRNSNGLDPTAERLLISAGSIGENGCRGHLLELRTDILDRCLHSTLRRRMVHMANHEEE